MIPSADALAALERDSYDVVVVGGGITGAGVALDRALSAIDLPEGVVTLVMTDVEGSTALWEEDPSDMAHALAEHDAPSHAEHQT